MLVMNVIVIITVRKSKRAREEGGGRDLSPVPFPEGKGCLLVGMTSDGWMSALAGMVWLPLRLPPVWGLGEGWGEVLN